MKHLKDSAWIWCDDSTQPNQYSQFFEEFSLNSKEATLYIAADTAFAVFLNGEYVPAFAYSDYPDCRSVEVIDISPYTKTGKNRLCIIAYCHVTSSFTYREGKPGIRFAIYSGEKNIISSNTATLSRKAPDYISGKVENITFQLGYTFHYNAEYDDGWRNIDYIPDNSWHSSVIAKTKAALRPRPIKKLILGDPAMSIIKTYGYFTDPENCEDLFSGSRMQYASLSFLGRVTEKNKPVVFPHSHGVEIASDKGDGLYIIFDMQREECGLLTLDIDVPQKCDISIGFGEHLDDLRVRSNVGDRQFCPTYRAKSGRQNFTYYFRRFGCRYLQLHIYSHSARIYYAGLRPLNYPLKDIPFKANDFLLDKIYEVSKRTLQLCIHEHYEDCPWREQGLYGMDSYIQMKCGYYAFGETEMPKVSLQLMADGVRQDGFIQLCSPSYFIQSIPSFNLAFIYAVKDCFIFTKDLDFVRKLMPTINGIIDRFLKNLTENGLLTQFQGPEYWNFYEWSDGLEYNSWSVKSPSDLYAPLQAMFILALKDYLLLCKSCDIDPAFDNLESIIAKMTSASQMFWDDKEEVFMTCFDAKLPHSELVQSLMILSGVATVKQAELLRKKMSGKLKSDLVPATLSHSIFKYDALMSDPINYASFVKNDIAKIWGDMLFNGATSFWETARGAWDFEDAGSLCHGWSSAPIYLLNKYKEFLIDRKL